MADKKAQDWKDVADRMPRLLGILDSNNLRSCDDLSDIPKKKKGIYVFYENDEPIYVGRTNRLRERISEHGSQSPTKSATFAYLLAKSKLEDKGTIPEQKSGKPSSRITNADVEKYPCIISAARKRVSKMQFRVVEITDAIEQTIFEVYAALMLGTTRQQGGYNDFEPH